MSGWEVCAGSGVVQGDKGRSLESGLDVIGGGETRTAERAVCFLLTCLIVFIANSIVAFFALEQMRH